MKKGNLVSEVSASDLYSTCELLGSQGVQGRDLKNLRSDKKALRVAARVIRFLLDNCTSNIIQKIEKILEITTVLNFSNICLALEANGWEIYSSYKQSDSGRFIEGYNSPFYIEAKFSKVNVNPETYLGIGISAGGKDDKSIQSLNKNPQGFESVDIKVFAYNPSREMEFEYADARKMKEVIIDPVGIYHKFITNGKVR